MNKEKSDSTMKTIDLHGIKHREVSDIMTRCCNEYDTPFIVITGKSSQMKRIVSAIAESLGFQARDSINNPGRLVIDDHR